MFDDDAERHARLREELDAANARLAEARYRAMSKDEYITVTVDTNGHVVDFEFNPRVRRLDTDDLREGLLSTITAARDQAIRERQEEFQSILGPSYRTDTLESGSVDELESMIQDVGRQVDRTYVRDEKREEDR